MKTLNNQQQRILKVALVITVLGLMSACGNTKSSNSPGTSNSTSLDANSLKPLATCNKAKDSQFSINTAVASDQTGQISSEYIKLKFNFLASNITVAGNVLKFYKWRVNGTQTILEPTALQVASYDLASGQMVGTLSSSLAADQVNGQYGYYIQLNDPNALFQVIKIVAYDSSGKVIGNLNSLIPAFNASPEDYKLNSDGTARADILQQLHLLYGQSVAGQSPAQIKQNFDQLCF